MMKTTKGVSIALENATALEIVDGQYRILASKRGKKGHKTYWQKGKYYDEILAPSKTWKPLSELLTK